MSCEEEGALRLGKIGLAKRFRPGQSEWLKRFPLGNWNEALRLFRKQPKRFGLRGERFPLASHKTLPSHREALPADLFRTKRPGYPGPFPREALRIGQRERPRPGHKKSASGQGSARWGLENLAGPAASWPGPGSGPPGWRAAPPSGCRGCRRCRCGRPRPPAAAHRPRPGRRCVWSGRARCSSAP